MTSPPAGAGRLPQIAGFRVLYAAMFVISTGNLAMMSLFPAIARTSGIPDALMVAVQSVSAGLNIFMTPFWAARSDRIGRRPVILLGIAGFSIASLLTAGAIHIATLRLVPVLVGVAALVGSRAVFGCFGLAATPAIQAHIADETPPAFRARMLATIASAQGLGTIVGPGIAPLLVLPVLGLAGPQLAFALAGGLILAMAATRLPRPADDGGRIEAARAPNLHILRRASMWPFVAYMALVSGCQAAGLQMLGFVVIDRTGLPPLAAQPWSGAAMMLGAAASVAIQLGLLRRLRLPPPAMMGWGLSALVAGNVLMVFAGSYRHVVLAYMATSVGTGFAAPAAIAGASLANPAESQGAVAGLISAASASGLLAAPILAMLIYRHSPASAYLSLAAVLALTAALIVPRCRMGKRQEHADASGPPGLRESAVPLGGRKND